MKLHLSLAVLFCTAGSASAVNLLTESDFIIAIDRTGVSQSSFPVAESPANAIDGTTAKYLNRGGVNTGFIVTPSAASVIQSVNFTTANDDERRDPASFLLYGTNSVISSTQNSLGDQEPWTLIGGSALSLPSARNTLGTPVDITDGNSYSSYRLIFDSLKDSAAQGLMQIGEVEFFTGTGGNGTEILNPGDAIIAVDLDPGTLFPAGEAPAFALDNNVGTKHLSFGEEGSGLIITPSVGSTIVQSFTLTTANDAEARDPVDYVLYGTNDAITSAEGSDGSSENWTVIQSGTLMLPSARQTVGPTELVTNTNAYSSYRIFFDSVKDEAAANSTQYAEIQFDGIIVPEPSSALLALLASGPLLLRRRRR